MNWWKIAQQSKELKVIGTKMYLGKYPKITFIPKPEMPANLYGFFRKDIRDDINERINGGEKWLLSLMSAMKKKYGNGDITWLMFNRFQDGTYWVDPYYAGKIAENFLNIGYNASGLAAQEDKGTAPGSLILDGDLNLQGMTVQIQGILPSYLKRELKNLQFWGEKIGNKFFWNRKTKTIKDQLGLLEQIFNIEEFDTSRLKDKVVYYYSNLFREMDAMELLKLKNEINIPGGFIAETIIPLIEQNIKIDTETGEITNRMQPEHSLENRNELV